MRRHEPQPDDAVTALARRLDRVDDRLAQVDVLTQDVAAIGRTLAELTAQVRGLAEVTNQRIVSAPLLARGSGAGSGNGDAAGAGAAAEAGEEQPNWLTVTDADTAAAWLSAAVEFADEVLPVFPRATLPDCWILHPAAVVEVLALQRQYVAGYASGEPGAVSEWLGRWLPATVHRLAQQTGECGLQRTHQVNGRGYQVPHLDPAQVALWWVESRGRSPDALEAFAMDRVS